MKKQLLTLLPLVLMLISCGKDVDPKVNKVDLSRLLSQDEISSAFKTIADNFSNKLVGMEVNLSTLEDNLIDQKNENSATGTLKIKGDEYAEAKMESTSKLHNNFYTVSTKTAVDMKFAVFGKYFITYSETVKDNQKDNIEKTYEYVDMDDNTISEAIASLPLVSEDLSVYTIGVDAFNTVYAVYSKESIYTNDGRDKEGKDATFIDKVTREVLVKCGNLKDPKMESYKVVEKHEANYNEERKIYSDYQIVSSSVMSYKFEYRNRGNNDGKDKFIKSLPDKYIDYSEIRRYVYSSSGSSGSYSPLTSEAITSASKQNYEEGLFTYKADKVQFTKVYAYGFEAQYYEITIDKANQTISAENKKCASKTYNLSEDFEKVTTSINGQNIEIFKFKNDKTSNGSYNVEVVLNVYDSSMTVTVK